MSKEHSASKALNKEFEEDSSKLADILKDQKITGYFVVVTTDSVQKNSAYYNHMAQDYMNLVGFVDTFSNGIKSYAYDSISGSQAEADNVSLDVSEMLARAVQKGKLN